MTDDFSMTLSKYFSRNLLILEKEKERERERERKREKHQFVAPLIYAFTG